MKPKLSALIFAAAALVVGLNATEARAIPVDTISINNGEFTIDEYSGGYYNVHNNSSSWYIWAFAVTNPNAYSDSPQTTFTNWTAEPGQISLDGNNLQDVNAYITKDSNYASVTLNSGNLTLTTFNSSNYIAPGTSSDLFTFGPVPLASDAGLLTVDSAQNYGQFSSVANTPLPASLPLFVTGLGLIVLFGWSRKRKGDAALEAI